MQHCAAALCGVPEECAGQSEAACARVTAAHLATVYGVRLVAPGPVCAPCAALRWHAIVTMVPTTAPADQPCANCRQPLGAPVTGERDADLRREIAVRDRVSDLIAEGKD